MVRVARKREFLIFARFFLALFCAVAPCRAQFSPEAPPGSALSIPTDQLIQPEALNRFLVEANSVGPVILQVGSRVMFQQAHIAGSAYAGPGSQAEGLKLLERKVAGLAKDRWIVLYCGCCPWNRCPNVGPAYHRLRNLGFTKVKVLYIANNFGADWVNKGYLVDHGE
ncbi:MAG TPA: hypothetical protein VKR52_19945 [Terracidiphilus sp.]|nr:hypothetical protein [Terracidiphilus sp.]